MSQVSHQRVYAKQLTSDSYVITEACKCGKLKEVEPTWNHCPFCGEVIDFVELEEKVLSAE